MSALPAVKKGLFSFLAEEPFFYHPLATAGGTEMSQRFKAPASETVAVAEYRFA